MSKDPDAPVKLIDFGAAVVLEEDEQVVAGGKVGTWTYWAPEQANKELPYDQAVDMWSVGVVLFIMLSGRHPFERSGSTPSDVSGRRGGVAAWRREAAPTRGVCGRPSGGRRVTAPPPARRRCSIGS